VSLPATAISLEEWVKSMRQPRQISFTFDGNRYPQFPFGLLGAMIINTPTSGRRCLIIPTHAIYRLQRQVCSKAVSKKTLQHVGCHDALTGLPNRALFIDRVHDALNRTP